MPWIMLYLPWWWIDIGAMPWGELRIEISNPRKITKYFGPELICQINFHPNCFQVQGNGWGWRTPRRPGHWLWELEEWIK